ncbi:MAG: hypothetical protein HY245_12010 [Rhizobiales bacterium]|nr:hypothetical protein [Hyphomicrobiales bacterium]MBI3674112.1 hypothetical protein [Hyphomicrobiales bacterium]
MILLSIGIVAFAVLHLAPALPEVKAKLTRRFGRAYGPLYGAASLLALALIVLGWRASAVIPVYAPPEWGRAANFVLTFVAFLCLGVFLFRGALRQRLRFPMAIAVLFWGTGHLLANDDLRGLILFGGLMVYAALHIAMGLARSLSPSTDVRVGHDLMSLLAGVALYVVMIQLHPILIGVPVLVLSR